MRPFHLKTKRCKSLINYEGIWREWQWGRLIFQESVHFGVFTPSTGNLKPFCMPLWRSNDISVWIKHI
jgi:hypothetical protein